MPSCRRFGCQLTRFCFRLVTVPTDLKEFTRFDAVTTNVQIVSADQKRVEKLCT